MKTIFIILLIYLNSLVLSASELILSENEKEWIKNNPVITLGSDSSWAPFIVEKNGVITGYDKDILNLINKKTGANFQLTAGKREDIMSKAFTKEIDGLSTTIIHKERANNFNFSDTYVTTQKFLIVIDNNSEDLSANEELIGKKIAYQESNLFDKKFISKYKDSIIIPMKSMDEIVQNMLDGKVDATIVNHEVFYVALKNKLPQLKIVEKVSSNNLNLVFSIRKDYPEAISIINKGLKAITFDERIDLDRKWFSSLLSFGNIKNSLALTNDEKEYIKNKKTLKVANLDDFSPFNFYENGEPMGYSIDYINLIGKYLDIPIEFISNKTWAEHLKMLKNKEIDLIPHVAITKEREEYLSFTEFYHIQYTTGIAVNKNSNISSIKDLSNRIIAVSKDSFLHEYLNRNFPKYTLLLTSSEEDAINSISLNKADVAIGSLPSLNYYIQRNWLSNIKTVVLNDLGVPLQTNLPMAVSKDDEILKSILDKINLVLPYNETEKLKEKWMSILPFETSKNSINSKEIAYLNSKKSIKICVIPDWLPFEQIDENSNYKGVGADIMELVSKFLDKPIELVPTTKWTDSLQNIRDRKCDILPFAMNVPSRRDSMNFTKPYLIEPFVAATTLDKIFIKDSASLDNKIIGVVEGFAFTEVLKKRNPSIQIIRVKDIKEGLEKVRSGELFGYVDVMPTIAYSIQKYSMFDVKIAGKLEFNIEHSVASRNDEPLLNTIMQKALDSISEERKRLIVGKWVEIKLSQEFDYTRLLQVIWFFIFVVLAILYKNRAVMIVNKKLLLANKEIEEQQKMVDKYVLILSTDTKGIITEVNQAFCKVIGFTKEELLGSSHEIMRHPDTNEEFLKKMWNKVSKNETWEGEIKNLKKDGTLVVFNVHIEALFKDEVKIGYRSIAEDITDKKRIEELSITDKLTGLYNRLKFDEIMLSKLEEFKRYKVDFSIILVDIDNFKMVNDTFGHDVGDIVLQTLAKTLKSNIRSTDILARWGGEEFIIIASNTDLKKCKVLAENIRKLVENINFEQVGRKTISLGITQFYKNDDAKSIFKRADDALYEAKTTGKNKVCSV